MVGSRGQWQETLTQVAKKAGAVAEGKCDPLGVLCIGVPLVRSTSAEVGKAGLPGYQVGSSVRPPSAAGPRDPLHSLAVCPRGPFVAGFFYQEGLLELDPIAYRPVRAVRSFHNLGDAAAKARCPLSFRSVRVRRTRESGPVYMAATLPNIGKSNKHALDLLQHGPRIHHTTAKVHLLQLNMFLWPYLAPFLLITVQLCKAFPIQRCEKFTDLGLHHAIVGTSTRVRLLLYNRHNDSCGTLLSHTNLIEHPQFNLSKPTTFIVHGFRPTGSPPAWLEDITKWLLARADINVVIVDWNKGAANLNYFKAVGNTYKVAENITAFIKMMQDHGASPNLIHMIGVSLGAHISGFVGANLNSAIGRITALDPAGPMFTDKPPKDRLDPTDAQFVDALHTDIDALGFREPLGHVDFYANGGTDQPGCPKTLFSGGSYFKCDHQRSVMLFLDTINDTSSSQAFPCSTYADFLDGRCMSCDRFGDAGCPVFGYDVIRWKDVLIHQNQTKYYFNTNSESPFCMTNYRVDVMIWNQNMLQGYMDIKLHNGTNEAVAKIDHKATKFSKNTETTLLAMFNREIQSVKTVSLKYYAGAACHSKSKLRILRIRITPLDRKERPLCRYDILLENTQEVKVRPIPCEETQS
ncbi:hypothetical protein CRENBAI_004836 [Crenichthys baileyi]|uniref:Lipase domain-containing protein n=1 Tax=Crenichthys baileyi TaxID=28760 RepID=A0AAV9SF77_9TELE